jgi:hypothetical protein
MSWFTDVLSKIQKEWSVGCKKGNLSDYMFMAEPTGAYFIFYSMQ